MKCVYGYYECPYARYARKQRETFTECMAPNQGPDYCVCFIAGGYIDYSDCRKDPDIFPEQPDLQSDDLLAAKITGGPSPLVGVRQHRSRR